jgi:hypothetical protein
VTHKSLGFRIPTKQIFCENFQNKIKQNKIVKSHTRKKNPKSSNYYYFSFFTNERVDCKEKETKLQIFGSKNRKILLGKLMKLGNVGN